MLQVTKRDEGKLIWTDEGGMKRGNNAAYRPLSDATVDALAHAAVAVAEQTQTTVLVPVTQIVRRKSYFLRLCECGHAGRANFRNGDESAAFELIAAKTWRCGWCLSEQPNPGRDDEEFAAATKAKGAA